MGRDLIGAGAGVGTGAIAVRSCVTEQFGAEQQDLSRGPGWSQREVLDVQLGGHIIYSAYLAGMTSGLLVSFFWKVPQFHVEQWTETMH